MCLKFYAFTTYACSSVDHSYCNVLTSIMINSDFSYYERFVCGAYFPV